MHTLFAREITAEDIAAPTAGENYLPGEDGYHDPYAVAWEFSEVSLTNLHDLMEGGLPGWALWFEEECLRDEYDGTGANWRELLTCDIERLDNVVILKKSGSYYLWDGWHRVAAAIIRGVPNLQAIIGTPI